MQGFTGAFCILHVLAHTDLPSIGILVLCIFIVPLHCASTISRGAFHIHITAGRWHCQGSSCFFLCTSGTCKQCWESNTDTTRNDHFTAKNVIHNALDGRSRAFIFVCADVRSGTNKQKRKIVILLTNYHISMENFGRVWPLFLSPRADWNV